MLRTAKYLHITSSLLDDEVFLLEIAAVLSPGIKSERKKGRKLIDSWQGFSKAEKMIILTQRNLCFFA
jgi:hypothetical protein